MAPDTTDTAPAGDTPLPSAPLWRRFVALLYDLFLLLAVSMAYGALATGLAVLVQGVPDEQSYQPMLGKGYFVGWYLALCGFYCFFWRRAGQTAGMRAWKIRLDAVSGGRPGWGTCALRCVIAPLSLALLGLGYLWQLVDRDNQALPDRLCGTRMVQVPKAF